MLQGSSKVCVMYHISLGLGADHREYQISSDFTFLWTLFLSRKSISTEKSKQKCTWDNLTYWMAVQIWRILSSANCLTFSFLEKLYPKKKKTISLSVCPWYNSRKAPAHVKVNRSRRLIHSLCWYEKVHCFPPLTRFISWWTDSKLHH